MKNIISISILLLFVFAQISCIGSGKQQQYVEEITFCLKFNPKEKVSNSYVDVKGLLKLKDARQSTSLKEKWLLTATPHRKAFCYKRYFKDSNNKKMLMNLKNIDIHSFLISPIGYDGKNLKITSFDAVDKDYYGNSYEVETIYAGVNATVLEGLEIIITVSVNENGEDNKHELSQQISKFVSPNEFSIPIGYNTAPEITPGERFSPPVKTQSTQPIKQVSPSGSNHRQL